MRKYFPLQGINVELPEEIFEEFDKKSNLIHFKDPFHFKKGFYVNTLLNFSNSEDQYTISDIYRILCEVTFSAFDKFMFLVKHEGVEKVLLLYKLNDHLYEIEICEDGDDTLYSKDIIIFIKNSLMQ